MSDVSEWRADGLLGGIVRLNLAVTQVLEGITGANGITLADYLVLGVVRGAPGQRSAPTAICEILGRTTGGMSLTLDRLTAAGWVRRSPDPDDRRRVVVELTPAGTELATRVNAQLHDWEASLELASNPTDVLAVIDELTDTVHHRVRS
ncbi:MAG: regulatory protein MarR [Acidimicrobiales bacterium]|nr:regulatory protein MarR [Acidimicrobiales bacterium]